MPPVWRCAAGPDSCMRSSRLLGAARYFSPMPYDAGAAGLIIWVPYLAPSTKTPPICGLRTALALGKPLVLVLPGALYPGLVVNPVTSCAAAKPAESAKTARKVVNVFIPRV